MKNGMESCMDFSPLFAEGKTFIIEDSKFHKIICGKVRTVECVYLCDNKLYFIEAKSTAPTHKERYKDKYYEELFEKIQQSIDMLVSKEIDVNNDGYNEFPSCFNDSKFSDYKLIFLLIVTKSTRKDCLNIHRILIDKLRPLVKIWKINVRVLTGDEAIEDGFVSRFVCKLDDTTWEGNNDCPRDGCIIQLKALSK